LILTITEKSDRPNKHSAKEKPPKDEVKVPIIYSVRNANEVSTIPESEESVINTSTVKVNEVSRMIELLPSSKVK